MFVCRSPHSPIVSPRTVFPLRSFQTAAIVALGLIGVPFYLAGPATAAPATVFHESADEDVVIAQTGVAPSTLAATALWCAHETEALARVREELTDTGELSERRPPIVFEWTGKPAVKATKTSKAKPQPVLLSLADDVTVGSGADARYFRRSYRVRLQPGATPTHADLLALTLSLRELSEEVPAKSIPDLAAVRRKLAGDLKRFAGIQFRRDLSRSPDGRYTLSTVWQNGRLRYYFREPGVLRREVDAPQGYLSMLPVWASEGNAFAYGSLKEMMVVQMAGGGASNIRLDTVMPGATSIQAAFDQRGEHIVFTGTDAKGKRFPVFVADPLEGRAHKIAGPASQRRWVEYARADAAAYPDRFRATISPEKRAIAQKEVDKLAALLPVEKTPSAQVARQPVRAAATAALPAEKPSPAPTTLRWRSGAVCGILGGIVAALAVAWRRRSAL